LYVGYYSPKYLLIPVAQGEMGVLDKHDMDFFEKIFVAYQTKNKPKLGKGF